MEIPSTLSELKQQRAHAAIRAHNALFAFLFAAQIFLYGTGVGAQQAGSSVMLCALSAPLCAVPLALALQALRRRHDMQPLPAVFRAVWGRTLGAVACIVTGALFLLDLLGLIALLGALGSARLLPLHEDGVAAPLALAALFVMVIFAPRGIDRLAFLARRVLPIVLLAFSFLLVRREPLSNLFPLFGHSLPESARTALGFTGAASCTLALGFSPCADAGKPARTGLRAVWLGAACAVLLLLSVAMSLPAASLSTALWPALLIHTGAYTGHSGLLYLLVVLAESFAVLTAMAGTMRLAVDAFAGAMPLWAARITAFSLAIVQTAAVAFAGVPFVFALLPLRLIPAALLIAATLLRDRRLARRRADA